MNMPYVYMNMPCIYIHILTCMHTYIHAYAYMYVCIHTYIHTYTHTCMHTYIHMHICTCVIYIHNKYAYIHAVAPVACGHEDHQAAGRWLRQRRYLHYDPRCVCAYYRTCSLTTECFLLRYTMSLKWCVLRCVCAGVCLCCVLCVRFVYDAIARQNVFSYYRMCSLTVECVLLL